MIPVPDLLDEITRETSRTGATEVRVHPRTFTRIAKETMASVKYDDSDRTRRMMHIALLSPRPHVLIRPDPACTVEDHLYFPEAP